jgi:hypothetical protein
LSIGFIALVSTVEATFGPSGLLRERLASGERGDLFASADMGQPLTLQRAGKAGPVVVIARTQSGRNSAMSSGSPGGMAIWW